MPVENANRYIEAHHWNGHSSTYGTGDQLLGLLRANWQITTISRVTRLHRGRQFTTFLFELTRNEAINVTTVVYNPFIQRLVYQRMQHIMWEEQGIQYEDANNQLEVVTMTQKHLAAVI